MRHGWFALVAAVVISPACLSRLHADQVGDLGDFSRFEFRGVKTYRVDKLIAALQSSGDLQFAAHRTASLDEFLAAVQSFFEQGYRNGGFAQPEVRVTVDDGRRRVVVTVTEGPRYVQGEIVVSGGNDLPLDTMRKCLLDPATIGSERLLIYSAADFAAKDDEEDKPQNQQQDDSDPPKWEPGEHVRFDKRHHDTWAKRLAAVLRDLGHVDVQIELELKRNEQPKTVDLVVKVVDSGRQIKADRIEVRGLKRNTRKQLLDHLEIAEGMRLDAETVAGIDQRLYKAARSISHEVSLVRDDKGGSFSLTIEVMELPDAPLLDEKFNERQVAFMRVGRWLDQWESNASYLTLHLKAELAQFGGDASLDMVISPSEGLTGSFQGDFAGRDLQYGLAATKARVAVYNAQRQRCYDHPPFPLATVEVKLRLTHDGDKIKSNFNLQGQAKSDLEAPLSLRIRVAPALLVYRASDPETVWEELENGLTRIKFETSTVTFDSKSGAVHEIVEKSEAVDLQVTFNLDKTSKPHEDFAARYFGLPNEYRPDEAFASFCGFVGGEVLWNAQAGERDADALVRRSDVLSNLVARRLGPALRSFSSKDKDDEAEKFQSPHGVSIPMTTDWRVFFAVVGPGAAEKLFPRESWPWVLLREAAFSTQGRNQYTHDEVQLLLKDPDVGPVGCLVLAKTMTMIGAKKLSHEFAAKGLDDLTLEGFRRDLALFTSGEKSAPKLLAAGIDVLRSLTLEEVTTVCELLKKPNLTRQVLGVHKFLAADDRPADQLLAARLQSMWEPVLRGRLEQSLERHLVDGLRRDSPFQP